MTAKRRLTNPERLLMGIFWDAEKPLDSGEVIRRA